MIIRRLVEHYEALKLSGKAPNYGWARVAVDMGIELSETGEVKRLIPLFKTVLMGKKEVLRAWEMLLPLPVVRTVGIRANFLYDNATYLFGMEKGGKGEEKFAEIKKLHLQLLSGVDNPFAKAICAFFEKWDVANADAHPAVLADKKAVEGSRNMVFLMHGDQFAQDDAELQAVWDRHYADGESGVRRTCLISGQSEPIARIHDKVKNVPGAQTAGANLISVNAEAAPSLVSYNISGDMPGAPIGTYSAFAYVTALNILLADFEHRNDLGDTRVVYWAAGADEAAADMFTMTWMPPPESDEHKLKSIFDSVESGLFVEEVPIDRPFYVLGLRPNAARISVSLFLESTFGNMIRNIGEHYQRLEIVRPAFDKCTYLSPSAICYAVINPNSKEKKPNPQTVTGLMRAILTGARYPYSLYENALMRIRAEQGAGKISRARAAIIKACLLQYLSINERECLTVALNPESRNKAYTLGRLFAVLESVQEAASPGLNSTIKDRFFNSACANPNIAFARILKLYMSHLKKVKREKPGLAVNLEKDISGLMDMLEEGDNPFPPALSLNDQGLFVLGYYHQRQARFTKIEEE